MLQHLHPQRTDAAAASLVEDGFHNVTNQSRQATGCRIAPLSVNPMPPTRMMLPTRHWSIFPPPSFTLHVAPESMTRMVAACVPPMAVTVQSQMNSALCVNIVPHGAEFI